MRKPNFWLLVLVVLIASWKNATANEEGQDQHPTLMWENCFRAPFQETTEHDGKRIVDEFWVPGGHAVVLQHFLRLTSDKQSRRGHVYNTVPIQEPDWKAMLRFRVSGKSKNLFGDGLAVWYEKSPLNQYNDGFNFGHGDLFEGFGIIFDTFRNLEVDHIHKDISLVIGRKGIPVNFDLDRPGCDSDFRYWEGRADFSTTSESKVKISLVGNHLDVEVDRVGNGNFEKCFSYDFVDMPLDWKTNTHFSISASTGALADNHDVMEFIVSKPNVLETFQRLEAHEKSQPSVKIDVSSPDLSPHIVGVHVNDLAYEIKDVDSKFIKFEQDLEHKLESLKGDIAGTINKVQEAEIKLEQRVLDLEARQTDKLLRELENRLSGLETAMKANTANRMDSIERQVKATIQTATESNGSWKIPVLIVAILFCAVAGYLYWDVQKFLIDKIY